MCNDGCRQRAVCQCLCRLCSSHALTCLFQISRSSFCFVSALTESGQVIPLHIASADNLADLGITQACLETFVIVQPSPCWLMLSICDVYRLVSTTCYTLVPLYFIIYCEHRKITREIIWRLTEHNMSYTALYDIKYFLTLSALVMLFKAYPSYICFLSVILCFLKNIFFKRHIFLSVILCFFKNLFFKRHIFLSDILCFKKNMFFFPKNIYMFLTKHIDLIEFNRTCIWLVPLNNIYVILM